MEGKKERIAKRIQKDVNNRLNLDLINEIVTKPSVKDDLIENLYEEYSNYYNKTEINKIVDDALSDNLEHEYIKVKDIAKEGNFSKHIDVIKNFSKAGLALFAACLVPKIMAAPDSSDKECYKNNPSGYYNAKKFYRDFIERGGKYQVDRNLHDPLKEYQTAQDSVLFDLNQNYDGHEVIRTLRYIFIEFYNHKKKYEINSQIKNSILPHQDDECTLFANFVELFNSTTSLQDYNETVIGKRGKEYTKINSLSEAQRNSSLDISAEQIEKFKNYWNDMCCSAKNYGQDIWDYIRQYGQDFIVQHEIENGQRNDTVFNNNTMINNATLYNNQSIARAEERFSGFPGVIGVVALASIFAGLFYYDIKHGKNFTGRAASSATNLLSGLCNLVRPKKQENNVPLLDVETLSFARIDDDIDRQSIDDGDKQLTNLEREIRKGSTNTGNKKNCRIYNTDRT